MPGDRPRWMLHIQAQFWRILMGIGMMLHRLARPLPPAPSFHKDIEATVSPLKGKFRLHFYVPKGYTANQRLKGRRYPCVINFHGGGFTLGSAHDDARWAGVVVEQVGAVVVSVDYRLAPEYPFPTAVEDGADAILYLARNADQLMLDTERFAVSGFSSGGNMSFTVPLCLQGELLEKTSSGKPIPSSHAGHTPVQPPSVVVTNSTQGIQVKIRGIVSFYPSTDYTQTREQRRQTCARKDQQLPAVFTQLFDDSYLQPPSLDLAHPWLSPGVAPDSMLAALPDDIVLFCCEWDMLLAEGERLRDRLRTGLGKRVHYHCVPGVPHGWDKAPNPLRESPGARNQYMVACKELRRMFAIDDEDGLQEV
ncbi:hypothetical protein CC78DRAFT_465004 [Lojkania enalia]|uniref:Alpha/beta hydrolase fold-3 domain-containing protein n=1 Tax=Lojkania enalia TaxID=147567 RepID=A0A9P4KCZ4_9PLEO|nr:hypothetical protein CC78DRAFT_465004 [Didymosphaeria enalia]